ncbi:hypothetical protein SAMN04487820_11035 [Actinopolyspora mzabensis]|uniref:Uncharacterized protein n=2 Tax=Actinopolyspora mzabensis TaxID=995066 RepID=A0A1G9DE72_ACTMZ|nr:hypothetical protein SAMN04487820_11035 [Actinopolyspora mzabensis]
MPYDGMVTTRPSRQAVTVQETRSKPSGSPAIVGSAVATIVWSSAASRMRRIRPMSINQTRP